MKSAIFGVLTFCLVFTHASILREDPLESSIRSLDAYSETLNGISEQISKDVDQKYEEIIVQPTERIEASALAIEERKVENEQCVDEQSADVQAVLLNFDNSLDLCTKDASDSGSKIATEVAETSVEISYDTYYLAKGVQRCRQYTNSILKNSCYAKQLIKAKSLLSKTKKAMNDLNQAVDETVPAILLDLQECSSSAEQSAQDKLDSINRNIDSCVATM